MGIDVSPAQRIEDMIRVTEFCIDLLKENEEHHGEVRGPEGLRNAFSDTFLSFFIPKLIF